jgi:hypothetical protein
VNEGEIVMNDLVQSLTRGEHDVEVSLRPKNTAIALKQSIDLGYIHIKFINTNGGTDLGVRLDNGATNLSEASFDEPGGKIHLVGNLTIDYVKVKCVADIDLATLKGKGHLEPFNK